MTPPAVVSLEGLEILDSRGRPTVLARCRLADGSESAASVPSGASTGRREAVELRDGDPQRYRGLGCRAAVSGIAGELAENVTGRGFASQASFDETLIAVDGTADKSRLGANALLAASLAFARAMAASAGKPLYEYFASIVDAGATQLPRPMINLFSGGKHAGGQVAIQDVLLIPRSTSTIEDTLAHASEVFQCAAELTNERFGMRLLTADEGGLAPPVGGPEEMIELALESIERAGFTAGRDVVLAVDVAASHFRSGDHYVMNGVPETADEISERLAAWVRAYPIRAIEDGLADDDWESWPALRRRLEGRSLTIGDDLLCTNPELVRRAAESKACDALLLKVNQVGTLTEAARALSAARSASWTVVASARSGETEDNWLADLAVGWAADSIKIGSITQSERLAKYNRLLAIERDLRVPLAAL